jgi:hypothetical protein
MFSVMNAEVIDTAENMVPDPFEVVSVVLPDGRCTLAVWTGRHWWGDGRRLLVVSWKPCDRIAAR